MRSWAFAVLPDPEFNSEPPPTVIRCDSYLGGRLPARRGGLARAELEELGREPELFTGRELTAAGITT